MKQCHFKANFPLPLQQNPATQARRRSGFSYRVQLTVFSHRRYVMLPAALLLRAHAPVEFLGCPFTCVVHSKSWTWVFRVYSVWTKAWESELKMVSKCCWRDNPEAKRSPEGDQVDQNGSTNNLLDFEETCDKKLDAATTTETKRRSSTASSTTGSGISA